MARQMSIDPVKPAAAQITRTPVVRTARISPHVQRVTLGGDDSLAGFVPLGFDQWFRILVTRPGQTELTMLPDVGMASYLRYLAMPEHRRPLLRNYTVREFRPETGELDVDFIVHGDVGPDTASAAAWAQRAREGAPAAILDEGRIWNPPQDADAFLIVADESAMPAVAGICRDLDRESTGVVILELPSLDDVQDLAAPDGVEVRIVTRPDAHDPAGRVALAELASTHVPGSRPYVFAAGESGLATGARRQAVAAGVDKDRISFCGFYKHGKAMYS